MKISVDVKGLEEFNAIIRQMPAKLQKKAIKPLLRELAKLSRADEQQALQSFGAVKTAALQKAIRVMTAPDKRGYPAMVLVGVGKKSVAELTRLKIAKAPRMKQPFYWRFLNFGHDAKNGKYVTPRPFRTIAIIAAGRRVNATAERYLEAWVREYNAGRAA